MLIKKRTTVEEAEKLLDEAAKKANSRQCDILNKIAEFIRNDLPRAQGMMLIWREGNTMREVFWKTGGIEPSEAILALDQLHHRIQHEGLEGYD